jgi:hypothetical protein
MARPKDSSDGATPSGNAVALHVLAKLAHRTGDAAYRRQANALLAAFANAVNRSPTGYGYTLRGAQLLAGGAAGPQHYAARGAIKVNARVQTQAKKSSLTVDLAIRPGWHINAHETLQEDLIPTVMEFETAVPGWRAGASVYPQPILKTLAFQSTELALYEGRVRITMDLEQTDPAAAVPLIRVSLHLQACDESVCLPPERRVLHVPVNRPLSLMPGPAK